MVSFGKLDDRGQTASVFQSPTGITGAPVAGREASCAGLAQQHRVEEGPAPGDGPLGQDDEPLARRRAPAAAATSESAAAPCRSTAMPPRARAIWPTTGASKSSFLARNLVRRPFAGDDDREGCDVEVAAVIGDEQERSRVGDVLDPLDVETGVGEQFGPDGPLGEVERLGTEQRHDPRRRVEVQDRPAPEQGERVQRRVRVGRRRVTDGRQQRQVVDAVGVGEAPTQLHALALAAHSADGGKLARSPDEAPLERSGVGAVPPGIAGADHLVEARVGAASGRTRTSGVVVASTSRWPARRCSASSDGT